MEPRPIAQSLSVLTRQLGMPEPGAIDRLLAAWGEAAGRLAVVSEPVAVRGGRLVVMASEPAAAEALEWQAGTICDRLATACPDVEIAGIDVRLPRR